MRIEEVEDEPVEVEEIIKRDAPSGGAATGIGHFEERIDPEDEGFETASEGSGDGDFDGREEDGRESSKADAADLIGDEEGRDRREESSASAARGEEFEEVAEKLAEVGLVEGQPTLEADETRDRQRRIEEANAAKVEGNSLYADSKYVEALSSYDRGLNACPLKDPEDSAVKEIRAVLYSNRAACYVNLQNSDSAVRECSNALELNPNYVKALVRRYQEREKLTKYEEAIEDVKKVLELDPGNMQARVALRRLLPLAEEKREKLKKEMLDKLKEAGNSILGRFGMSVDNFKTVQDPNTGSYSIQFQR